MQDTNIHRERTALIKKCILNHRVSMNLKKESLEETCVADADALAHMQDIAALFYYAYHNNELNIEQGKGWIRGKIERDWKKMSDRSRTKFKNLHEGILQTLE